MNELYHVYTKEYRWLHGYLYSLFTQYTLRVLCDYYSGEYQLGYEHGSLCGTSWYALIHPEDIEEARFKHMDCKSASTFAIL